MDITLIDHKGFISAISQDAPCIILFRNKDAIKKKLQAVKDNIKKLDDKKMPKAYFYEFIIDESPENEHLCETLEVPSLTSLILYKNGCFNQYKNNPTIIDIKKIWGSARVKSFDETTRTKEEEPEANYM